TLRTTERRRASAIKSRRGCDKFRSCENVNEWRLRPAARTRMRLSVSSARQPRAVAKGGSGGQQRLGRGPGGRDKLRPRANVNEWRLRPCRSASAQALADNGISERGWGPARK